MKVLFFDYDGTLTSKKSGYTITQETIDALKMIQALGNKIILCTGRASGYIQDVILPKIPFDGYIACAGCEVYLENEKIANHEIETDLLKEILPMLRGKDIFYSLENGQGINLLKEYRDIWFADYDYREKHGVAVPKGARENLNKAFLIEKNGNEEKYHPCKIGIASYNVTGFEEIESKLMKDFYVNVFKNFGDKANILGELTLRNVNKADGMKLILDRLQADVEDTYAFGDGPNDIPMLKFAKHSYIFEGAEDNIKALADETFKEAADGGIAEVLNGLRL